MMILYMINQEENQANIYQIILKVILKRSSTNIRSYTTYLTYNDYCDLKRIVIIATHQYIRQILPIQVLLIHLMMVI